MCVAGVAVLAAELAASVGIDGPGERELAFGDGLVEDGARLQGLELDEVSIVSVRGFGGEAGEADWGLIQDGEERIGVGLYFRHMFASMKVRLGVIQTSVKRDFSVLILVDLAGLSWVPGEWAVW